MVCIWQYGECMMSINQGKRKEQVEFSEMMVAISFIGMFAIIWFYATYHLLMWFMDWILK